MKNTHLLALLFLVSCSSASENITDEISLFSNSIKLVEENEKCYLAHGNIKEILSPSPPCHFIRDSKSNPQYYVYKDVSVDAALIVSGTPVSKETRKEWGLPDKLVCGMESQGVLIKKNEIQVTKKVLEGGVLCRDKGTDEKNFWFFAH